MLAEHPYLGYTLYVVFHKKEGRRMANLVKSPEDRTTISYARYLMAVHLGRELGNDEHVDHINDIKTDDFIWNLQILTQEQNREKYVKANPKKLVGFICTVCGIYFEKEKRQTHGTKTPSCSRKCGGIKGHITKHAGMAAFPSHN